MFFNEPLSRIQWCFFILTLLGVLTHSMAKTYPDEFDEGFLPLYRAVFLNLCSKRSAEDIAHEQEQLDERSRLVPFEPQESGVAKRTPHSRLTDDGDRIYPESMAVAESTKSTIKTSVQPDGLIVDINV